MTDHAPSPTHLLLLGGRSGVGKTTVAAEISSELRSAGIAHCHIEGDNLDAAYPRAADDPDGTRLTEQNLAALWRNYRSLGHHRLVYVNTASVLEPEMLARALLAGGSHEVVVVAVELTARDDTVTTRLADRERGGELQAHLKRSRDMAAYISDHASAETLRVGTDGRDVAAIAAEVIELSTWRGTPEPGVHGSHGVK